MSISTTGLLHIQVIFLVLVHSSAWRLPSNHPSRVVSASERVRLWSTSHNLSNPIFALVDMAGGINMLHRSVAIATAITIFLAMVGIAQSTEGFSIITNELNTDLRFALYSDTLGYKTQIRKRGETLFFSFDLALSTFWNVSMLAPNEVPEKSKTIQVWSRVADPSNPTPLSQWNAREDGLYVYDSVSKSLVFAIPWDFA